jgi:hypothetical protein
MGLFHQIERKSAIILNYGLCCKRQALLGSFRFYSSHFDMCCNTAFE